MKLGVLACCYGNPELTKVNIQKWTRCFNDIELAVVHSQFKEYHELGYEDNDKETLKFLLSSTCDADFVWWNNGYDIITGGNKEYLPEHEVRNKALEWLLDPKRECTHIFILDGDETYEQKDIDGLFKFVNDEPFTAWFAIQFRNLTFSEQTYTRNFSPPRVFKVNYNGYKLKRFYYDNDVMYVDKDGREKSYKELVSQKIPSKFCWPLHYSWLDNENSRMKVEYQKKRWGNDGCMFDWIDGHLAWNEAFFKKTGLAKPELFKL